MKRNSDGETGPAPKRLRPMGDTELRLLVYSKVINENLKLFIMVMIDSLF